MKKNVVKIRQRNYPIVPYIILLIVTFIGSIWLAVWSGQGVAAGEMVVHKAKFLHLENAQTEYLVGQQFNGNGLTLNIGSEESPNEIALEDCEVSFDSANAGNKKVTVTYATSEYESYQASLFVKVLFVKNISIVNEPNKITMNSDGTFTTDESFKMVAELSELPKTDAFEIADAAKKTVVLTANDYETTTLPGKSVVGYYDATISCANLSYKFSFYNDANRTFFVTEEENVVNFANTNAASSEKLTLVVMKDAPSYKIKCMGESSGYYVYTAEDGTQSIYDFAYELSETESFKSVAMDATNALTEENVEKTADAITYSVTVNGNKFTVDSSYWQPAVVDGLIIEDGGYKMIVADKTRVYSFGEMDLYDSNGGSVIGTATLTLYVSYYTFNTSTANGTTRGFYIFTANGVSYKVPYYAQAWTWDYVPLSAWPPVSDVPNESGITIKDIRDQDMTLGGFHIGDVIITVSKPAEFVPYVGPSGSFYLSTTLPADIFQGMFQ